MIRIGLSLWVLLFLAGNLSAREFDQKLEELFKEQNVRPLKWEYDLGNPLFMLGQQLYRDTELSGNRNISCQTCHHEELGTGDELPLPIGEGGAGLGQERTVENGKIIPRNSPKIWNLGLERMAHAFWDGRVSYDRSSHIFQTPEPALNGENPTAEHITDALSGALAAQALFPPLSHEEMRGEQGTNEIADAATNLEAWDLIVERILSKSYYQTMFRQAFKNVALEDINMGHVGTAIAFYESQRFAVFNTPFDEYLRGDKAALSDEEKKGAIIFYSKGECSECHTGGALTDFDFHNVAFPQMGPGKEPGGNDLGRYYVTGLEEDKYKFKTPGLRNVALTAPYGHSGSLRTLEEVIAHYVHPMRGNHHFEPSFEDLPYELSIDWNHMNDRLRRLDPKMRRMGVRLTRSEEAQLALFLRKSLTQIQ